MVKKENMNIENNKTDNINDAVLEEINSITDCVKGSYFAKQAALLTQEFLGYGVTAKDVCYVAGELLSFDKVQNLLDGYVLSKKRVLNVKPDNSNISIKDHVELYKTLSENENVKENSFLDWTKVVHYMMTQSNFRNLNLKDSFNAAKELGSYTKVGDFFDFSNPIQEKSLDERIALYKNSSTIVPESLFLLEEAQNDFNLPLKVMNQKNYRSDWRDSSHAYEHAFSMLDHD